MSVLAFHVKSLYYNPMGVKRWAKIGKPKVLAEGFGKRFLVQKFKDHHARVVDFFMFGQPDFSIVLPVTEDGNVILVRQFKQGSDMFMDEIPAGGLLLKETPANAARRELLEETGYRAGKLISLGSDWIESRSSSARCHCFLALGCRRVTDTKLDDQEDLQIIEKPLRPWLEGVLAGKGTGGWGTSTTAIRSLRHLGVTINYPKNI